MNVLGIDWFIFWFILVPVVLLWIWLTWFLWRTHRKDKKPR